MLPAHAAQRGGRTTEAALPLSRNAVRVWSVIGRVAVAGRSLCSRNRERRVAVCSSNRGCFGAGVSVLVMTVGAGLVVMGQASAMMALARLSGLRLTAAVVSGGFASGLSLRSGRNTEMLYVLALR